MSDGSGHASGSRQPLRLSQGFFRLLADSDVALRTGSSNKKPIADSADQVVQKIFDLSLAIDLVRFGIHQPIATGHKVQEKGGVLRIVWSEHLAETHADEFVRGSVTVEMRHSVVAFGKIGATVKMFDLLVCGFVHG